MVLFIQLKLKKMDVVKHILIFDCRKFVCLNDNLDPKQESENAMVRAVLRDFYHSFFPLPSKFELPPDMRNRFLHISELNNWKESRGKLRIAAILAVVTLCLLTCAVVCPEEVCIVDFTP